MENLHLVIIILCISLQHITKKIYNIKHNYGTFTFAFATVTVALIVYSIIALGNFRFNIGVAWYSLGFALSYSVAAVTSLFALKHGPLSLTSLITAFSLIIPTLYGLFALGEPLSITLVIGLILLILCLVLIKFESTDNKKITLKWVIYVTLAFLGNGICSTVQKVQQINFNGDYKNEFMVTAFLISAVILLIISLIIERKVFMKTLHHGFLWYGLCGFGNGMVNILVMAISLSVAASVMFPVMSVGSITLTALVSVFAFKERLSPYQKLGVLSGLFSIVFLNM